jgi:hypothetical protein
VVRVVQAAQAVHNQQYLGQVVQAVQAVHNQQYLDQAAHQELGQLGQVVLLDQVVFKATLVLYLVQAVRAVHKEYLE